MKQFLIALILIVSSVVSSHAYEEIRWLEVSVNRPEYIFDCQLVHVRIGLKSTEYPKLVQIWIRNKVWAKRIVAGSGGDSLYGEILFTEGGDKTWISPVIPGLARLTKEIFEVIIATDDGHGNAQRKKDFRVIPNEFSCNVETP